MSAERFPISPPARQSIGVRGIKLASKMTEREWQRLRTLVVDIAAKFFNTQDRHEHQDPEMVRLFYQTFHSMWPEVAERYQMSWVLVWYLKVYLLKQVYRKRWCDKVPCERAVKSDNSLNTVVYNHCSSGRNFAACDESDSQSGSTRPAILRSTVIAPQHSGSSTSPVSANSHSVAVQSTQSVFQFLESTTPSLVKFVPEFLSAGIYDQNHLEDFFTWPEKAQRKFLLKTFRMNALGLGASLMVLNSRHRGPSDM